jgi:hypothetical protein
MSGGPEAEAPDSVDASRERDGCSLEVHGPKAQETEGSR